MGKKVKPFDLEFDSVAAMARYLETTDKLPGSGDFSIREDKGKHGGMEWDEAMSLAKAGGYWAEGAEKMVQGVADAAALRENHAQPMLTNTVAGFMPDVPAYLAGVPDCMVAFEEGDISQIQRPVVTIGVGIFAWSVSPSAVINRGVAILSLIDAIESVGYRVQLDYVGDNTGDGGFKKIRVVLKRAGDHWNPGQVAFATAHAAMLRRLTVACLERDPATVPRTKEGYGHGDDGYIEEYSLAFPYMTTDRGYDSLEDALESVERIAADFGMEVKLRGQA
jgi:hypothetical protein